MKKQFEVANSAKVSRFIYHNQLKPTTERVMGGVGQFITFSKLNYTKTIKLSDISARALSLQP